MKLKRRVWLIISSFLVGSGLVVGLLYLTPLNILSVQPKPEQAPQKVYDYYLIIDEATNRNLMYVPLVVSVGDEVLTEENQRFQIVRIEENRAYARYVEDVNLDKYKQNLPAPSNPSVKSPTAK